MAGIFRVFGDIKNITINATDNNQNTDNTVSNTEDVLLTEEQINTPLTKLHNDNTFGQKDLKKDGAFNGDVFNLRRKLEMAYEVRREAGRLLNKYSDDVTLEDVAKAIKFADDILHAID